MEGKWIICRRCWMVFARNEQDYCSCGNENYEDYRFFVENCDVLSDSIALAIRSTDRSKNDMTKPNYDFEGIDNPNNAGFLLNVSQQIEEEFRASFVLEKNESGSINLNKFNNSQSGEDSLRENTAEALLAESPGLENFHYYKDIPDFPANLLSSTPASSNELTDSIPHIGKPFDNLVSESSARTEWDPLETGDVQTGSTRLLQDSEDFPYFKDIPGIPANLFLTALESSNETTNLIPNIGNPFGSLTSESSARTKWSPLETVAGQTAFSTILQDSVNFHYFEDIPDIPANLFSTAPASSNELTYSIPNIGNPFDSLASESSSRTEWSPLETVVGQTASSTILQGSEIFHYFKDIQDIPANLFSTAPASSNELTDSIPNRGNPFDSLASESSARTEWSHLGTGYGSTGSSTEVHESNNTGIFNDIIESVIGTNQQVNYGDSTILDDDSILKFEIKNKARDMTHLEQHQATPNEMILKDAVENWKFNQSFTFSPEKNPQNFNFNEISSVHGSTLHSSTPRGVSKLDMWNDYQVSNYMRLLTFLNNNPAVNSINNKFDVLATNISETVECPVTFGNHPHGNKTRGSNLSITQNIAEGPYRSYEGTLDIHNNFDNDILRKTYYTNNIMNSSDGMAGLSQTARLSDCRQTSPRNLCLYNSREKKCPCNQCDKRFPVQSPIKTHLHVCTKKRPIGCSGCDKRFCQISRHNEHPLTRPGERLSERENFQELRGTPNFPTNRFSNQSLSSNDLNNSTLHFGNHLDSLTSQSPSMAECSFLETCAGLTANSTLLHESHHSGVYNNITQAVAGANLKEQNKCGRGDCTFLDDRRDCKFDIFREEGMMDNKEQNHTTGNEISSVLRGFVENWRSNQSFFPPEKIPQDFDFNEISIVHDSTRHPSTSRGTSKLHLWNDYQYSNGMRLLPLASDTSVAAGINKELNEPIETIQCSVPFGVLRESSTRDSNLGVTHSVTERDNTRSIFEGTFNNQRDIDDVLRKSLSTNILNSSDSTSGGSPTFDTMVSKKSAQNELSTGTSTEKKFLSDHCGERFSGQWAHKDYLCIHTDERTFCSTKCNTGFAQKCDLNHDHILEHTEKKPHVCGVCGKGFFYRGNLKRHEMIHNPENPHTCDVCGKTFNSKGHLRSHNFTHFPNRCFTCDVCGKGFSFKSDLTKHEFIHVLKKPHVCHVCGKGFAQKGNRDRHLKTHRYY
ncbi:Histone-lysine N-methyltransferase PRDM9 [Araneus ventricosus]|uniref:Histone-lysine N-methyltransferase PRDM9 n=1 Tax=Araneus ventricosus TaxID=182803 RepID=A0A4Y2NMR9_ARAVE|nr:Histone-lysine N-methyltransferase PRDM9 [Araneus ventricosus]